MQWSDLTPNVPPYNVNSDNAAAIARNGGTFQKVIALTLLIILGLLPTCQNIRLTLIVTNYFIVNHLTVS